MINVIMRSIFFLALIFTYVQAVHVSDVKDAHVNIQVTEGTNHQSHIHMRGGQTNADSHSQEHGHVLNNEHDQLHVRMQDENKERTKGTLNYHKAKEMYHRIEQEDYIDELNAAFRNPNAPSHPGDDNPRTKYLQSKSLEHGDKIQKHKTLIRELKDGVKLPGEKNVDHLRSKKKLPKGYS